MPKTPVTQRSLVARMAATEAPAPAPVAPSAPPPPIPAATPATPTDGSSLLSANTADPKSEILNKHTIAWLVVIVVIVLASLVIISCLLCRCKRRRKKRMNAAGHSHHASLEVTDGRNIHSAWNKNAPHRPIDMLDQTRDGAVAISLMPLTKAAVRPAGYSKEVVPGVSVVEEEEDDAVSQLTPVYGRNRGATGMRREATGSRYHSVLSNAWKRISQIGKAY
ncbi:uncharacterized protein LTR77_001407 [Saxophila tyrrhenica]|uniref:Uncharacterized protein n=1 Tax=Saxophila tyrrhenica TaxID=1690608 RepID=A0AAV9PPU4_9PEZI|nr:hypothetical protein LTR77_001407 [Saxophila tyrrhenica]